MDIEKFYIKDNGKFPNNERLPVLLYKDALTISPLFPAFKIKGLFNKNNWKNSWQSGIFTYSHYHSITHEVLGIYKGKTTLLLGGDGGIMITVSKGDILIIPAGVAHKNLQGEFDVHCVGAYPNGNDYDIKRGYANERPAADKNIAKVELPDKDPLLGISGELLKYWK